MPVIFLCGVITCTMKLLFSLQAWTEWGMRFQFGNSTRSTAESEKPFKILCGRLLWRLWLETWHYHWSRQYSIGRNSPLPRCPISHIGTKTTIQVAQRRWYLIYVCDPLNERRDDAEVTIYRVFENFEDHLNFEHTVCSIRTSHYTLYTWIWYELVTGTYGFTMKQKPSHPPYASVCSILRTTEYYILLRVLLQHLKRLQHIGLGRVR
jgi:hypothetical protein